MAPHLGGIDDSSLHHVDVLVFLGVIADEVVVSLHHLVDNNTGVDAGVGSDLEQA